MYLKYQEEKQQKPQKNKLVESMNNKDNVIGLLKIPLLPKA
jgi:hypothetical protein